MKYQTGFKRLGAAVIDSIIFIPLILIEQWAQEKKVSSPVIFFSIILNAFLPLLYSIILHYRYGQTLGKWVVGVKVVDISELNSLTLKQSVVRDSFGLVAEVAGLVYFVTIFMYADRSKFLYDLYNDYADFTALPLFCWAGIELISMLMNHKRRAVHDFLAKTVVIRL